MSKRPIGGSRQAGLLPRSRFPTIPLAENHRLVQLTDRLDWVKLEGVVEEIRLSKLKSRAGRPPHLRALIGGVLLMADRRMPYREAEDQIRHYAPARYLCGLTQTDWTPDFTTLHDFTALMGEDGLALINQHAVKLAVKEKFADPRLLVADTTAQEAAIPWPNEMGLMAGFLATVATSSKKAGSLLKEFVEKGAAKFKAAKEKVRKYRLFAKSKEAKTKLMAEMATLVEGVQARLGKVLCTSDSVAGRLVGHGKSARAKVVKLHETMKKLLPQIRYWLRTGHVASGKIINLNIPELYSIVRGKVGKAVEFGLKWGMARLRGGFLLATLSKNKAELEDTKFALRAVDNHIALFGQPPHAYAYDRGGYSKENVHKLQRKGVKEVGLAPRGKAPWSVTDSQRAKLVKERALVEGSIGAVKSGRYGFNRPAARSAEMMGACGQRAVLGFNLNKLAREFARREGAAACAGRRPSMKRGAPLEGANFRP